MPVVAGQILRDCGCDSLFDDPESVQARRAAAHAIVAVTRASGARARPDQLVGESTSRSNARPLDPSPRPVLARAEPDATRPSRQRGCAGSTGRRSTPARGTSSSWTKYARRLGRGLAQQRRARPHRSGGSDRPSRTRGIAARCSWISRLLPGDVHGHERDPVLRHGVITPVADAARPAAAAAAPARAGRTSCAK